MKTIIFSFFLCLFSFNSFAQTAVIAAKAKSIKLTEEIVKTEESFGLPPKRVDTIKKISDTQFVEIGRMFGRNLDTLEIKDYYMFKIWKYNFDSIKKYNSHIVFVGFNDHEIIKSKKKRKSKNSLPIMVFIGSVLLLAAFHYKPKKLALN